MNELEIAHPFYEQGDRTGVRQTGLGTIGLMVCADGFTRGGVVARTLATMGAQVILSPCAWAVPPGYDNRAAPYGAEWEESYTKVAERYGTAVVAVSNVGTIDGGPWDGYDCIGNSRVVVPGGGVLYRGPFGRDAEAIVVVDIPVRNGPGTDTIDKSEGP